MAQTWHQLRPGEIRNDCGGCHAHSQKPTAVRGHRRGQARLHGLRPDRADAAADRRRSTTSPARSGTRRTRPACASRRASRTSSISATSSRSSSAAASPATPRRTAKPAGNLGAGRRRRADADSSNDRQVPGHLLPPGAGRARRSSATSRSATTAGGNPNASRYVRKFQSRRSLLIWKVFGQRLDGWSNDDFPTETVPGDPSTLQLQGQAGRRHAAEPRPCRPRLHRQRHAAAGSRGRHLRRAGRQEDQGRAADATRIGGRWCAGSTWAARSTSTTTRPTPSERGYGWMLDDNRPTLTLTYPRAGANAALTRILVGMHDYDTGLDMDSFQVTADFAAGRRRRPARTWRRSSSRSPRASGS